MKKIIFLLTLNFLLSPSFALKGPPLKSNNSNKKIQTENNQVSILTRFGHTNNIHEKYLNLKAPKGGVLKLATVGTFDTLNNLAVKGIAPEGLALTMDSLMIRSPFEPFTLYCVIAEKVELAPDNSKITFYLNPNAKFHNGDPILAEDVKATFKTLEEKGLPRFKNYFSQIKQIEISSPRTITIYFKPLKEDYYDSELPFNIATLKIFNKKQLESLNFADSGLTPLIGSGPYKIEKVEPGKKIILKRDPNYWAKDLPIFKGQYNFNEIQIEYFKNNQAQFQAFLAKEYDVYFETDNQQWEKSYNVEAVKKGHIQRIDIKHNRPVALKTIIFNMRKSIFKDYELRRALVDAFDVFAMNKVIFSDSKNIPNSLFANTVLAHTGKAEGKEKEILETYKDKIPSKIYQKMMSEGFQTLSAQNFRERIKIISAYLDEAGYKIVNAQRLTPDGQPVVLEMMLKDPRLEKIALMYKSQLSQLGIKLNVKVMDAVQYENRVLDSDFDMIIHTWSNSLSPGNEQVYYFSPKTADMRGSSNYIGVKDAIAHELALQLTQAKDYDELKYKVKALDRYVMHQCFQIPLMYDNNLRFAYWKEHVAFPEISPDIGTNIMNWGWSPKVQDENRMLDSDFYRMIHTWSKILSPGNKQVYFFSPKTADLSGINYIGIKDPITHELAPQLKQVMDYNKLKYTVKGLDRFSFMYDDYLRFVYWKENVAFSEISPDIGSNMMNSRWSTNVQSAR